jgi:hypothetical protein
MIKREDFKDFDESKLYLECVYSDGQTGTVTARYPVSTRGEVLSLDPVAMSGKTFVKIATPGGGQADCEVGFEIPAKTLAEGFKMFPQLAFDAFTAGMEKYRSDQIRQTILQTTKPGRA